jgi:hypothetical protein
MDDRKISLTPGATLHFGSIGFVYTGLAESVTRRTFTRPPRPNVLTGAARCEAFVRGFSDETIIGMLVPNPTQERLSHPIFHRKPNASHMCARIKISHI